MDNSQRFLAALLVAILVASLVVGYLIFRDSNNEPLPPLNVDRDTQLEGKQTNLPQFSDYPVSTTTITATLPAIDLASHPLGQEFRVAISAAGAFAPNFAGEYTIVAWGCGTNCQSGAIINRSTGRIIGSLPASESGYAGERGSSLLVVNPYSLENEAALTVRPVPTYYLTWNGQNFSQISAFYVSSSTVTAATSTLELPSL